MLTSLSRHNCDFSKDCITLSNLSVPVVVLLRLSMDNNSSVMQKCLSIPLIKISNCAVSNISVLSSEAIEKHLDIFAVFNKFFKLAAMASILQTVVFLDIKIASISDFISGHTMLIASTMQSFTNSASKKRFVAFCNLVCQNKTCLCSSLLRRRKLDKGTLLLFQLFNHIYCLDFQLLC